MARNNIKKSRTSPSLKAVEPEEIDSERNTVSFAAHKRDGGERINTAIVCGDDRDNSKAFPMVQIKAWGEEDVHVQLIENNYNSFTQSYADNKLTLSHPTKDIEMYMDDQNRFEFGATFHNRGGFSGRTALQYQYSNHEGFRFSKQPDPSGEPGVTIVEIDDPDGNPVEYYQYDFNGEETLTPVRMAGGYAVLHNTKRGVVNPPPEPQPQGRDADALPAMEVPRRLMRSTAASGQTYGVNYGFGLAFYIERAWAEDSVGSFVWLEPEYDHETGIVTIPAPSNQWLNDATFPVFVGPNLGLDDITGTSFSQSTRAWGWMLTPTENGTIDELWVYRGSIEQGNLEIELRLYDDSSTSPNNLDTSGGVDIAAANNFSAWNGGTYTGTETLVNGTPIWLHHQFDGNVRTHWLADGGSNRGSKVQTFGSWPDPHGAFDATSNQMLASYIVYTASGGGGFQPAWAQNSTSVQGVI